MDIQYEHNSRLDRCTDTAHTADKKDSEKNNGISMGNPFPSDDNSLGIEQSIQLDVIAFKDHHQNSGGVSTDRRYIIFHDEYSDGSELILSHHI